MSGIFQSRPGIVKLLGGTEGSVAGSLVTFEDGGPSGGTAIANGGHKTVLPITVTGIGYSQNVNIQFMPTLKKLVYVYAFGDNMGNLRITGLAFDHNCYNKGFTSGWGTQSLFTYYDTNRAVKDGQVVGINIAGRAIRGFLISMDLNLVDIAFKTMGFTLNIATLPNNQGTGGAN